MAMVSTVRTLVIIKVSKMVVIFPATFVKNYLTKVYLINVSQKVENTFVVNHAKPCGEIANYTMAITT